MIRKQFDLIEKPDIDALLADGVSESRTLDYKLALPNRSLEQDRIHFLADVCAFANTAGGDLLYGVDESDTESGTPALLPGLADIDADAEIRRLDQMIFTGIAPRVQRVRIKQIRGFEKGPIILLRVAKSFTGPHAVTKDEWLRYYVRSNTRNIPLDVQQVYAAHTTAYGVIDSIRRFRSGRLHSIAVDETPVPLTDSPRLVLHVLPVSAFDETTRADVLENAAQIGLPSPMGSAGTHHRYNLDGIMVYTQFDTSAKNSYTYVQLFRSGNIEAVRALEFNDRNGSTEISGLALEDHVLSHGLRYLDFLRDIGVEPPIHMAVSLLGVLGHSITSQHRFFTPNNMSFDRDVLQLPEATFDDYPDEDVDLRLRPVLDSLWRAGGYEGSPHYGKDGRHRSRNIPNA